MSEWWHLLGRWIHIVTGVMWIGDSLLFNWLDRHFTPPEKEIPGVKGELWLVHSGGFYQLLKKQVGPGEMPKTLHWFRWEAASAWLSGIFLLSLLYYSGEMMTDPVTSPVSEGTAIFLGIASLIVGWVVYDLIWKLPLPQKVVTGILLLLLAGTAFGLGQIFSGRAMYYHVGSLLGTIMVANVWMRILPAQRHMIAATGAGEQPDLTLGARAKLRSKHNNYMTYPLLFIMVSNHFPSTYGSEWNWVILMVLTLASMGFRHLINTGALAR